MRCVLSTSNDIFMPGQNSQCENHGVYPIGGELGEYLVGAKICKVHLKYLMSTEPGQSMNNARLWVTQFKAFGLEKGHLTGYLQAIYRKQTVESELS